MRALSTVYEGRADLEVKKVQELDADFAAEQFPNSKHGLIIYDADGAVVSKIEGHQFGKEQIITLVDEAVK